MNIRFIKETCIYAHDLDAMRAFYAGILGLPVIDYALGKHIFFRAGTSVLLCFNPADSAHKKSPPGHGVNGVYHFAFEVADYAASKQQLQEHGIVLLDTVIWKTGQESCYFHDPAGNVVELVPAGIWD